MRKLYFFLASVALLAIGIWAYRSNATTARLKTAQLVEKDRKGSDVAAEVTALERFTSGHMNSDTSFTLEGKLERDTAAAIPQANGAIYAEAQANCQRGDSVQQARCVSDYVAARVNPNEAKPVILPNRASYTYNFRSPGWTPDLAGIALLAGFCGLAASAWMALPFRKES
jgi:hypothetical protein